MSEEKYDERGRLQERAWYAFAIAGTKERVVVERLNELAETQKWGDQIFRAVLPTKWETDDKGKEKEVLRYTRIGYIEMILNNETFNAISNELKVDGFRTLLPSDDPVPIPGYEMEDILREKTEDEEVKEVYEIGDLVQIIDKQLAGFYLQKGMVSDVNDKKEEVSMSVEAHGKAMTIKCRFDQIQKEK